ncbi:hypothetical protein [Vibrio caribbeanicus]|uniref:hypothetical protein n=1 Tax=Vibrio caribbeanicus TaxID=701175 RepID=UPI0022836071|nr:hypothetical protein [Vibrio caribbeanicus]MCY9845311.1 hypothetical protein [Vibrio caribbeanicus]
MKNIKIAQCFCLSLFASTLTFASDDFNIKEILSGEHVEQFALGDTDGDGRDEIIYLNSYGQMKIAENYTHSHDTTDLSNSSWLMTNNWMLEFQDSPFPAEQVRVKFSYIQNGQVYKSKVGLASVNEEKIEVNLHGYSGNPAVIINYLSLSEGKMRGFYKDISYSNSRSYSFTGIKQ